VAQWEGEMTIEGDLGTVGTVWAVHLEYGQKLEK
jgi:hypothetical protein